MRSRRTLTKAERTRLGQLPRRESFILQGTMRDLSLTLEDDGKPAEPLIVLWMDGQAGSVRASQVVNATSSPDSGMSEALELLLRAISAPAPMSGAEPPAPDDDSSDESTQDGRVPELPARVEVDDPDLAERAEALLQPLDIPVRYVESLPLLDAACESLTEHLTKSLAEEEGPFEWETDETLLPSLFAAAREFYQLNSWEYLPDVPPLSLRLGEHGPTPDVETLFAAVLGEGGMEQGVAFYFSAEALRRTMLAGAATPTDEEVGEAIEMLRGMGAPMEGIPEDAMRDIVGSLMMSEDGNATMEDSLALVFDTQDESDPTYLTWLDEHQLMLPDGDAIPFFARMHAGGESHPPNARETRALLVALSALNRFCAGRADALAERAALDDPAAPPITAELKVSDGKRMVNVRLSYPPPLDLWPAEYYETTPDLVEPAEPASPEAMATLYRLKVELEGAEPPVWRRIELRGDQTLHDLHLAIQDAFDWDDDHPYGFYLNRKAFDPAEEYLTPFLGEGRPASAFRLEALALRPKKKILYIFDFGDEWRHTITIEAITPGGVSSDEDYPRITERHGENVQQYADEDNLNSKEHVVDADSDVREILKMLEDVERNE